MARFEHGFTLAVDRPGAVVRFGNHTAGESHTVEGCAAAPAGSVELINGQQTVIAQDTIYGPYDADVKPTDTVTVPEGQPIRPGKYQVDGEPQRWKNPQTGWQAGCVIRLTRVN